MIRKKFLLLIISLFFVSISTQNVLADHIGVGKDCIPTAPNHCVDGYSCQKDPTPNSTAFVCQPDPFGEIFGKIQAPDALKGFIGKDPTGAGGISTFLSNLIALIYSLAAIVLIFMLIWGAFQWMTSGGDKEKIEAARNRIIHAIIGLILFAIAFAVIQVLGQFTGFTFFVGQK